MATQASKLAEGQFRLGDISEFDARLARTDALRLETSRLTRVAGRDLAVARLRTLLGLDPQAPQVRLSEPAPVTTDSCPPGPELFQTAHGGPP